MDADSGRILSSSNMNSKMLIASTTKIMTAIVAIENANLKVKFKAKEEIEEVYGSMIYIKKNEQMTLEDLLYGLLLQSGNDAAMIIATNVKGYNNFIRLMNEKAIEIGMYNTTFENPHGLDDDSKNYSTAYDLALLMQYAMKNSTFRKITKTKKYIVKTINNTYEWYNKNDLLTTYKYATGGKIGYTKKSSHIFVSSATKNKENLIVVTLKDTNRFVTHKSFYNTYFERYDKYQLLDKYTFSVKDEYYEKYHLYIKNDYYVMIKESEKQDLELNIILKKAKVKNNVPVGYAEILINGRLIHKENIYAVSKENKLFKLKSLLFFWR